jgi:hypothetical protein
MVGTHRWWIDCFDETDRAVAHSDIYHMVHDLDGMTAGGSLKGRISGGPTRDYAKASIDRPPNDPKLSGGGDPRALAKLPYDEISRAPW